jgi:hypothetical protein
MYYEILAKELVKDALREAEKRRLLGEAKNAHKREGYPLRFKLPCKLGLVPDCPPQMSI